MHPCHTHYCSGIPAELGAVSQSFSAVFSLLFLVLLLGLQQATCKQILSYLSARIHDTIYTKQHDRHFILYSLFFLELVHFVTRCTPISKAAYNIYVHLNLARLVPLLFILLLLFIIFSFQQLCHMYRAWSLGCRSMTHFWNSRQIINIGKNLCSQIQLLPWYSSVPSPKLPG